jgi:hypothetical protein
MSKRAAFSYVAETLSGLMMRLVAVAETRAVRQAI